MHACCNVSAVGVFLSSLPVVPFVDPIDVLKCDSSGRTFTNVDHDISLRVPPGAIADGVTVHIEVGVTLHGPFQFPPGTRPISPIIWLCMQEGIPFQKPVEVILPHFLHDWEDLQLGFLKADHSITNTDCGKKYTFHPVNDSVMDFKSENNTGFGILSTYHFCFLCIEAKITYDQLHKRARYCLSHVTPHPWPNTQLNVTHLYFCVTFFNGTCLKVIFHRSNHSFVFTINIFRL